MKQIFGQGTKLFGRVVIVLFMSVFVCISVSALCTALFTEEVGYDVYGLPQNGDGPILLYRHYTADGEDTQMKEYETQGYSLRKAEVRSELSKTAKTVCLLSIQGINLLMLIAAIYPSLWQLGAEDSKFTSTKADRLKGVKIGLVSQIPDFLLWCAVAVLALGAGSATPVTTYRLLHCQYYALVQCILGSAQTLHDLSAARVAALLLPLMIVPLVAGIAYVLGGKRLSVGEKLLYKNGKKQKG